MNMNFHARKHFPVTALLFAVVVLVNSLTADAQEFIRSYIEDSTFLLAEVNLSKVDLKQAVKMLATEDQATSTSPALSASLEALAGGILNGLRSADVNKLYITSSLDGWFSEPPFAASTAIFIPSSSIESAMRVVEPLVELGKNSIKGLNIYKVPGGLVICHERLFVRIKDCPKAHRDDLIDLLSKESEVFLRIRCQEPLFLKNDVKNVLPEQMELEPGLMIHPRRMISGSRYSDLLIDLASEQLTVSTTCEDAISAAQLLQDLGSIAKERLPLMESIDLKAAGDQCSMRLSLSKETNMLNRVLSDFGMSSAQQKTMTKMRQVAIAIYNFENNYAYLPPRETRNKKNESLLSWRVFLLPYLNQEELYKEFHLDEAWDSPHNKPLISKIPEVFQSNDLQVKDGYTQIVLPICKGSLWEGEGKPRRLAEILDGTSNTILLVEGPAEKAVIWTKPEELSLGESTLVEDLAGDRRTFTVVAADGSSRMLPSNMKDEQLRLLLQHSDEQPTQWPD
jgi:hypothetical protein